jgi:hypothetical protein
MNSIFCIFLQIEDALERRTFKTADTAAGSTAGLPHGI